jgi:hypothetical protein
MHFHPVYTRHMCLQTALTPCRLVATPRRLYYWWRVPPRHYSSAGSHRSHLLCPCDRAGIDSSHHNRGIWAAHQALPSSQQVPRCVTGHSTFARKLSCNLVCDASAAVYLPLACETWSLLLHPWVSCGETSYITHQTQQASHFPPANFVVYLLGWFWHAYSTSQRDVVIVAWCNLVCRCVQCIILIRLQAAS